MSDLFAVEQEAATGAIFSPCRKWRYLLWRTWDARLPHAAAVYMNPSKADEVTDDPTVTRWRERARRWADMGFLKVGGVKVTNAFAWRETDSTVLKRIAAQGGDLIGPENDQHILDACKGAAIVVCGWGLSGHHLLGRGPKLLAMLRGAGIVPHALNVNTDGSPQHPLYTAYHVLPHPLPMESAS